MSKWEYKLFDTKKLPTVKRGVLKAFVAPPMEEVQAYMNELGEDGWEIINIDFDGAIHSANSFVGVAKRKKL